MEYTITSNNFRNDKLVKKTIFYYETEEEQKIAFNHFIKSLIKNKFEIDIYNKTNHITAKQNETRLEITTYFNIY